VKAQAAIAVGILCYMPIRPQNLWALKFDEHIVLHEGPGSISSLELSPSEVKNRTEIAFDIPPHLAKMLVEYRNRIAPKVIGRRPDRLFVKADGTAKNQWPSLADQNYLRKRAGLKLAAPIPASGRQSHSGRGARNLRPRAAIARPQEREHDGVGVSWNQQPARRAPPPTPH
jgi:hypothetical protein